MGAGVVLAGVAAWPGLGAADGLPAPSSDRAGLENSDLFTMVCTTSAGTYDASRKLTVLRPQGGQSSPDVTLRREQHRQEPARRAERGAPQAQREPLSGGGSSAPHSARPAPDPARCG